MILCGAFFRVLARSPLGRVTGAHADRPAAVVATGVLVLGEGVQAERRQRRQLPLFWHRFLAPCFTAAPRFWVPTAKPVWDPATWQLIAILDAAWNADGVSFVGRERGQHSTRSEEHTSELQSRPHLVCRLLLEKKKIQ